MRNWVIGAHRVEFEQNGEDRAEYGVKAHNFPAAVPEHLAEQAEEALRSSYNLEFLGIRRAVKVSLPP